MSLDYERGLAQGALRNATMAAEMLEEAAGCIYRAENIGVLSDTDVRVINEAIDITKRAKRLMLAATRWSRVLEHDRHAGEAA